MPQVSKYPLGEDLEERVFEVFWKTIAELDDEDEVKKFFLDLLTPTEQIMLAKRLAIAILLPKDWNYRSISQSIKVSAATIGSVANWLKRGGEGYKMAIDRILKEERWQEIFEKFEDKLKDFFDLKRPIWKYGPHEDYRKTKTEL